MYNLFFFTTLSIRRMDKIPKTNEQIMTKKIPNQLIVIWLENNSMLSQTALATMIGMLIKKEKSNASSLLTPARRPKAKVVPLLEIPGRRASP